MVLVGLVANEVTDARGQIANRDGKTLADQKLIIGAGCDADVERPGYLWAYANDAWGTYKQQRPRHSYGEPAATRNGSRPG